MYTTNDYSADSLRFAIGVVFLFSHVAQWGDTPWRMKQAELCRRLTMYILIKYFFSEHDEGWIKNFDKQHPMKVQPKREPSNKCGKLFHLSHIKLILSKREIIPFLAIIKQNYSIIISIFGWTKNNLREGDLNLWPPDWRAGALVSFYLFMQNLSKHFPSQFPLWFITWYYYFSVTVNRKVQNVWHFNGILSSPFIAQNC